ncbi:MAG: type I glutamate--ammonia ligase [Candidatus Eisenbacteria bacterium]|uniref:Type I glutamate--ammonia ligase n=1 Tax=Eiseniibacteriota bacterium TaxID=2212470 RepID=A0A937XB09_UNCEI|nr:type I glutamate--ammonia ligase [Candidatus Eisenbacteria bacterium]
MAGRTALQTHLRRHKVEMIDLKFSDLAGRWRHVTLPVSAFDASVLVEGIPFDGSNIAGFIRKETGDMVLIPDPATMLLDPFWKVPTLSFICQVADADTRAGFARDPRSIAQRAVHHLRRSGIADGSLWLAELEFYVFREVRYASEINSAFYHIDSDEADWNSGSTELSRLGHNIPRKGGYHACPPMDSLYNLRAEMSRLIETAGLPVRYHHHEVGGPGQCEIELTRVPLIQCADGIQWAKYAIKNLAMANGFSATFMPKPLYDEAGSGMHFHQNLTRGRRNLFYDRSRPMGLSETALHYIGGLLKHGRALLGITNPSTNSYKRLIPGFEAPTLLFYGLANRSAALRVPKYANRSDLQRVEFRPPDGTCNPYLALAAMLMAGLDGIRQRIDPNRLGLGPINERIEKLAPAALRRIAPVPASLREALRALESDHAFLTEGGVFPEDFFPAWISQKIEREVDQVRNRPHPYEMNLYYDA